MYHTLHNHRCLCKHYHEHKHYSRLSFVVDKCSLSLISANLGTRLATNSHFPPVSPLPPICTRQLPPFSSLLHSHLAMAPKSGSFATFLILCRESTHHNSHHASTTLSPTPISPGDTRQPKNHPLPRLKRRLILTKIPATCFFLGIIFSLFPYDYPILWSTEPTPPSHYDYLEAHLRFLHASPPLIPRMLHIVIFLGLAGLITKLYRPSESNMLFDGASLVLYMCGITVYIANIVKGLRLASVGQYGSDLASSPDEKDQILGREDSLKVLAASNTILALVLVGILVLQAGQWYADQKDAQELNSFATGKKKEKETKDEGEPASATASGASAGGKPGRQGSQRKKSN